MLELGAYWAHCTVELKMVWPGATVYRTSTMRPLNSTGSSSFPAPESRRFLSDLEPFSRLRSVDDPAKSRAAGLTFRQRGSIEAIEHRRRF